jgi:hypothetical protein
MTDNPLVKARKRAEHAVEGMEEGPLKIAAFQGILAKLLSDLKPATGLQRTPDKATLRRAKLPDTLTARVVALRSEGFFKAQRSLGEVREALGSRGWHYPATTLSGVMQSLVQKHQLRRERVNAGKKRIWSYSNV